MVGWLDEASPKELTSGTTYKLNTKFLKQKVDLFESDLLQAQQKRVYKCDFNILVKPNFHDKDADNWTQILPRS